VKLAVLFAACVAATAGAVVPPDPRWQEASGDVRVLVVRATWGPRPAAGGDLADAAAFYERASFGKLRLKVDVTPWLSAYSAPLCPSAASSRSVFGAVGEGAQAAAEAAGTT
jgi:hypothetical protein